MARLPQLERAFGQDQLARHHRVVGFTSFNLMVVHVVLITWGYAAGQLGPTPATFWDLITDYPGMLLALAGTACVGHDGGHRPQGRPRAGPLRVLAPAAPVRLPRRRAGVAPPAVDRAGVPRLDRGNPYSLSAAPDGRGLRITVKELGDNSAQLRALHPGTPVLFEGPFGRLTARARTHRRVALIGAGVGLAPLRALAEGLEYAPGDAVLLHRFTDRPLFERELHQLTIKRGLQVLWLPGHRRASDSWLGAGVGAADDVTALTWWVPDLAERDVYVCGPEDWIETVRRVTQAAGLPADQLHIEKFRW